MSVLTLSQIHTAQAGGISGAAAASEIVAALDSRITYQARSLSLPMAEDLAQEGRVAVWQAVEKYTGDSADEFETYAMRLAAGIMTNARIAETSTGVSRSTAGRWERAMKLAGGDARAAEQIAQDASRMGKDETLSADAALSARLAYQGSVSLDAPQHGGEATWQDLMGIPEDLAQPADIASAKRKLTCERVHTTLGQLRSKEQRTVLCALTGVDPVSEYGPDQDDDLAADTGIPRSQIKVLRSRGKARFAELWYQAYGQ